MNVKFISSVDDIDSGQNEILQSKYFSVECKEASFSKDEETPGHLLRPETDSQNDCYNFSQESKCDRSFDDGTKSLVSFSQLSLSERERVAIGTFYNITPRNMPNSPHQIIEEEFCTNPWAMLVATVFLTKTAGKIARPFMQKFFKNFPTPYRVLETNPADLEAYFETLGLRKRGHMIWRMSYQFVSAKWRRASDLCGIGKYGEDAYRIFCLGHTDVEPCDRYLRLYLDWLKGHTEFLIECGNEDCEQDVIIDPVLKYYSLTLK